MGRGAPQLTGDRIPASGRAVLDVVDAIPAGAVLSYGDVAALAGLASARQVGQVLARHGHEVPWHRVVLSDGSIATHNGSEQISRLRAEGVAIVTGGRGHGRVDMAVARWRASDGDAPAPSLEWVGRAVEAEGVRQRRFDLERDGRVVPGLLWTPVGAKGPRPLVLIGHGAGNSKTATYVVSMARRLIRHHGFAAAAIDGPVHGDRRRDHANESALAFLEFAERWAGDPGLTDDMTADWCATLDALERLAEVGTGPVAWWGLSMGTIFGLPVVARDGRIVAAVLGCMGSGGPTDAVRAQVAADAAAVTCPVLFLMQWDDEIFSRSASLDLFGALGSTDKRLHLQLGAHAAVPLEEMDATEAFLAQRLA